MSDKLFHEVLREAMWGHGLTAPDIERQSAGFLYQGTTYAWMKGESLPKNDGRLSHVLSLLSKILNVKTSILLNAWKASKRVFYKNKCLHGALSCRSCKDCRKIYALKVKEKEGSAYSKKIKRPGVGKGHRRLNTHCSQGHEYTKESTYLSKTRGHRMCRICTTAKVQSTAKNPGSGSGSVGKSKTHCPQNHEYSEENTYTSTNISGGMQRHCRVCRKAASDRSHAKKKSRS